MTSEKADELIKQKKKQSRWERIKDCIMVSQENLEHERKLGQKVSNIGLYNYTCVIDKHNDKISQLEKTVNDLLKVVDTQSVQIKKLMKDKQD